jgi:serine/threonine protein kinase
VKTVPFLPDDIDLESELSIMNKVKSQKVDNLVHVRAIYFLTDHSMPSKQASAPKQSRMGIVMDWFEDGSLRSRLVRTQFHKRSSDCLRWTDKLQLVLDVCNGLGKLHEMNVLHRDVKSDNVLLKMVDGVLRGTHFSLTVLFCHCISVGIMRAAGYLCDFGLSSSRDSVNDRKQKGCV